MRAADLRVAVEPDGAYGWLVTAAIDGVQVRSSVLERQFAVSLTVARLTRRIALDRMPAPHAHLASWLVSSVPASKRRTWFWEGSRIAVGVLDSVLRLLDRIDVHPERLLLLTLLDDAHQADGSPWEALVRADLLTEVT